MFEAAAYTPWHNTVQGDTVLYELFYRTGAAPVLCSTVLVQRKVGRFSSTAVCHCRCGYRYSYYRIIAYSIISYSPPAKDRRTGFLGSSYFSFYPAPLCADFVGTCYWKSCLEFGIDRPFLDFSFRFRTPGGWVDASGKGKELSPSSLWL
ncbi:unnamed protein product [Tuber aestivum]|uniref:Uncharacterized protein n=1 Tax=Tuber aestivum TaxID=59557 RepID=A0A292PMA2_9PEZI|nr:unnamed protein product [Tuber aestivum]